MKKLVLFFAFLIVLGCKNNNYKEFHKSNSSKHGAANKHMLKSSVDELIQKFESPERDAYQKPEKVLEYLGNIEGLTIMDIGAGSGYFSVKLAKKGAKVIAADVDDSFQEFIKNRIKENNLKNIETRKIPYDSPSLKDEEVDIVLIVNTYHHIENRSKYFQKIKKGINSNGKLIIIDFFKVEIPVGPPVNHKLSIDEVIKELQKAGYTTFHVNVDLLPYQYIIEAK
ncbi:class I SAM-dependent methyltransferase [Tenacibaculum sp. MEBiC06402]|uniref:class I SAM-dependent methyltransferase n=1 Tax=unclassified Tenacibaculum TaxID=2635139 RepID=UPI003B9AD0D1